MLTASNIPHIPLTPQFHTCYKLMFLIEIKLSDPIWFPVILRECEALITTYCATGETILLISVINWTTNPIMSRCIAWNLHQQKQETYIPKLTVQSL